jgi:hypothetical protein
MIYSVSAQLYEEVADRLLEAIADKCYFSGSIECESEEGVLCRLVTSCVVYREPLKMPEGEGSAIRSVIPVWWEFHTESKAGRLDNDFSFRHLNLEKLL